MSVRSALTAARRTALAALVPGVAGLAALAGPMAHADAASPCTTAAACIQSFTTHAGGLDVSATFETPVPTYDRLDVYDTEARQVTVISNVRLRTTHVLTTASVLTPNTKYTFRLEEEEQNGHTVALTGTFTTLHRQVDVMFQTVGVTDDSDALSPGDFKTWVKAGTTTQAPALGQRDITDNQTVPLAALIRTRDAGTITTAKTELIDNDCTIPDFPFVDCPFPGSPTWNSGSTPLWDWSTASIALGTATATNGPRTFVMLVNGPVDFQVHGWYSVTFVA